MYLKNFGKNIEAFSILSETMCAIYRINSMNPSRSISELFPVTLERLRLE
jgi:hypothetical protein